LTMTQQVKARFQSKILQKWVCVMENFQENGTGRMQFLQCSRY